MQGTNSELHGAPAVAPVWDEPPASSPLPSLTDTIPEPAVVPVDQLDASPSSSSPSEESPLQLDCLPSDDGMTSPSKFPTPLVTLPTLAKEGGVPPLRKSNQIPQLSNRL
ncbi:unnamed protein product [Linum trigynum]|uniref:Uncharacterized protein n=1 Tax=Linum trigynum TaxID=586398 RepID=A0AAV2F7I1_9ROSI